jgi:hypothetical protein
VNVARKSIQWSVNIESVTIMTVLLQLVHTSTVVYFLLSVEPKVLLIYSLWRTFFHFLQYLVSYTDIAFI